MRNCVQWGIGKLNHFLSVIVWRGCILPISHSLFRLLRFVATCIEYSITVLGNVFAFYGLLAFEYGSEFLVGTVWPALVLGMEKMKSGITYATRATLNCLEIIWSQFLILLLARILQILLMVTYFTIDGILATIYFAGRCIKLAFRIIYTTMRVIYLTLEFTTILFSRTLYHILEIVVQAMAAISIGVLTVMTYAWRALQIILGLGFTLFDVTVVIPIVHILHWLLVTGVSIFRAVRVWLATESEFGRWIKQQLRGVRYYFIAGLYNLQFLLRVAIGGSLLLTMLGLTFLVDHAYMLCSLLYSFSVRTYNFVVYIAAFIAWCASSFYLYFVTPAFEVIGMMIDMLFAAVYNSVLFIAFCVRAIYNYFAWITRVSGNALVALAQMGWLWIKDRTVKGYHFFKPPVLRMIGWTRDMWQISKTLLSSSFLFFSSSLRASFSYIRARWSSFSVAVSRTLRSVAGSCVRAMGVVRDMVRSALGPVRALAANVKERYREVKGRVGERWRNMKQKMGEKWRNMKQRMGERWREMKQRMGTVKEAAGERWRRTKQRVQGSFNYAKERVNMAKANVQQQWKQMKDKMKQRWERIKLMFQMYKVMTKRRMREVKERASTSWRRARGLLVTSEVQT